MTAISHFICREAVFGDPLYRKLLRRKEVAQLTRVRLLIFQVARQVFFLLSQSLVLLISAELVGRLFGKVRSKLPLIHLFVSLAAWVIFRSLYHWQERRILEQLVVHNRLSESQLKKYGSKVYTLDFSKKGSLDDEALKKIVNHHPNLENFSLNVSALTVQGLKDLQAYCPNLKKLDLQGRLNLKNKDYEIFAKFNKLTHLSIDKAPFLKDSGVSSIAGLYLLRYLMLKAPRLTSKALKQFSAQNHIRLTEIKILSKKLKMEDLLWLANSNFCFLERFSFYYRSENEDDIEAVLKYFNRYCERGTDGGTWHTSVKGSICTCYFVRNPRTGAYY